MPWSHNDARPQCDCCGRFIAFDDIQAGRAMHKMVTPDSDVSSETWETICPGCLEEIAHDVAIQRQEDIDAADAERMRGLQGL